MVMAAGLQDVKAGLGRQRMIGGDGAMDADRVAPGLGSAHGCGREQRQHGKREENLVQENGHASIGNRRGRH
jgi:hypothetical protein